MKAIKFKVGDVVRLIERIPVSNTDWTKQAGLEHGIDYTVLRSTSDIIDFIGEQYSHYANQFELKPDVITVVLRRPVDRKAIEEFLNENGYWQEADMFPTEKSYSRIIQVHLTGRSKGELTYNGQMDYDSGTKEAIDHTNQFLADRWGYKNIKVIKSKPSVTKAINELKKYI